MSYVFYYKIACLLAGLIITYWGYRLFINGVFVESGDVDASLKNSKLIIKKALPGTYFVILGSIIIISTISKGLGSDEALHYSPQKPPVSVSKLFDTIKIK